MNPPIGQDHTPSSPTDPGPPDAGPPASSRTPRPAARWKRPAKLALAALLLTGLFTQVPLSQVIDALRGVQAAPVLLAILAAAATQAVMALRLQRLTAVNGDPLSLPRVLEINLTTRFYSLFVPGGNLAGNAIRFVRLARQQQHLAGTALALAVDRVLATVALGLVGLAFFAAVQPPNGWPWLAALLLITTLSLALVLPAVAGVPLGRNLIAPLRQTAHHLPTPRPVRKLVRKALSLAQQTKRIPPARLAEALGWSVLMHALGAAAYWQLALALHLDLHYTDGGWARTAMLTATLLPLTFAGLGLREGAAVLALGALGIAGDDAIAFALLCFAVTLLLPGILGGTLEAARLFTSPRAAKPR